ncbi:MAG: YIP1 family protein [Anaerolineales bacterium]|nr:YIP1 family protein [Anaerolineales bacterium]
MSETAAPPLEKPRRFHFNWVIPALLRPRAAFRQIAEHAGDAWLTPLLVLTLAELARVLAVGNVRQVLAASGQVTLPPDFQYWPPTMQEQFMQAQQAVSGPVFLYVLPGFVALMGIWLGWLLLAGILHLVLTMLGGRNPTRNALNVVAWAALPLAVRSLVRAGFALSTQTLITSPGLAGFAPLDATLLSAVLRALGSQIDIYFIWYTLLTLLGARLASGLPTGKVVAGGLAAVLIVLALQTAPGLVVGRFEGLEALRSLF